MTTKTGNTSNKSTGARHNGQSHSGAHSSSMTTRTPQSSTSSRGTHHTDFRDTVTDWIQAAQDGLDVIERGVKVAKETLSAIKKVRDL